MEYESDQIPTIYELLQLYNSVGWKAYTADPAGLLQAVQNSTLVVVARNEGSLVGLVRVLSDDVSILYVQDLLVHPDHHRQGVGRFLLEDCLSRFDHVRQRVLLTDGEISQHRFYEASGFHYVARLENAALHAFVNIAGVR